MRLLRHTDEWVGLLVVVSVGLFIAAVLHAGVLSDWFRPTAELRVVLPESGSQGLSAGADVIVLGTKVGTVRRVVVDPKQRLYAEAELDEQATAFIRRDSKAVIRKTFGVAGAAYLDISRGSGAPLDWKFAVIDAVTERDASEDIGALIDQLRAKIFPVLDDAGRMMHALADTAQSISEGHGDIGRLVKDEQLVDKVNQTLGNLQTASERLNAALADVKAITDKANGAEGVPAILARVNAALVSVQQATRDVAKATPRLPGITRDVGTTASDLPALVTQAQAAAAELEKALNQLRHTWPLSGAAAPEQPRLSPSEVRP